MSPLQKDLEEAKAVYDAGTNLSRRALAAQFNLNPETLRRFIAGEPNRQQAREAQQRLSAAQERQVEGHIIDASHRGYPLTHRQVMEFANYLAGTERGKATLNKNWIYAFKKRNPGVQALMAERIDVARLRGCEKSRLETWLEIYGRIIRENSIPADAIWNMDETGIVLNAVKGKELVYTSRDRPVLFTKRSGTRTSNTAIECISASGKHLSTAFIFKSTAKKLPAPAWETQYGLRYRAYASPKAWTSQWIFFDWLRSIFIPETAYAGKMRLLLIDGASPHYKTDVLAVARAAGVVVLYLPSHTSHMLQPLDVAVFSPLKSAYKQANGEHVAHTDAGGITRNTFLRCYAEAHRRAVTEKNARAGFAASGLYPFSPSRTLRNPFVTRTGAPEALSTPSTTLSALEDTPYTPIAQKEGDVLRQLVNTGSGGLRNTRAFRGKIQDSIASVEGVSRLTDALVTSSNRCNEQAAYISRLERELQDARHTSDVLREATRRTRRTEDPNERTHGALDEEYLTTGMVYAEPSPGAYEKALRLASLIMDH